MQVSPEGSQPRWQQQVGLTQDRRPHAGARHAGPSRAGVRQPLCNSGQAAFLENQPQNRRHMLLRSPSSTDSPVARRSHVQPGAGGTAVPTAGAAAKATSAGRCLLMRVAQAELLGRGGRRDHSWPLWTPPIHQDISEGQPHLSGHLGDTHSPGDSKAMTALRGEKCPGALSRGEQTPGDTTSGFKGARHLAGSSQEEAEGSAGSEARVLQIGVPRRPPQACFSCLCSSCQGRAGLESAACPAHSPLTPRALPRR